MLERLDDSSFLPKDSCLGISLVVISLSALGFMAAKIWYYGSSAYQRPHVSSQSLAQS